MDRQIVRASKSIIFYIWLLIVPVLIQDSFSSIGYFLLLMTITMANGIISLSRPCMHENKLALILTLSIGCVSLTNHGEYSLLLFITSMIYCITSEMNDVYVPKILFTLIMQVFYSLVLEGAFRTYIIILIILYFNVCEDYI